MASMKETKTVSEQYKTADNLMTRMRFQGKYSVNSYGFNRWITDQYRFERGYQILELGCGNGTEWARVFPTLPSSCHLTLSDFSEGMLAAARENLSACPQIAYRQIDIQQIPYPDHSMDIIIANMMLYHVPDLNRALQEVKRVLKPTGVFYSATYGENGIIRYLGELFASYGVMASLNDNFTLQNGASVLGRHFNSVERRDYEDRFEVTDADDLYDYLMSLSAMVDFGTLTRTEILRVLEGQKVNGIIHIPKEYGLFLSRG